MQLSVDQTAGRIPQRSAFPPDVEARTGGAATGSRS